MSESLQNCRAVWDVNLNVAYIMVVNVQWYGWYADAVSPKSFFNIEKLQITICQRALVLQSEVQAALWIVWRGCSSFIWIYHHTAKNRGADRRDGKYRCGNQTSSLRRRRHGSSIVWGMAGGGDPLVLPGYTQLFTRPATVYWVRRQHYLILILNLSQHAGLEYWVPCWEKTYGNSSVSRRSCGAVWISVHSKDNSGSYRAPAEYTWIFITPCYARLAYQGMQYRVLAKLHPGRASKKTNMYMQSHWEWNTIHSYASLLYHWQYQTVCKRRCEALHGWWAAWLSGGQSLTIILTNVFPMHGTGGALPAKADCLWPGLRDWRHRTFKTGGNEIDFVAVDVFEMNHTIHKNGKRK